MIFEYIIQSWLTTYSAVLTFFKFRRGCCFGVEKRAVVAVMDTSLFNCKEYFDNMGDSGQNAATFIESAFKTANNKTILVLIFYLLQSSASIIQMPRKMSFKRISIEKIKQDHIFVDMSAICLRHSAGVPDYHQAIFSSKLHQFVHTNLTGTSQQVG